MVLGRTNSVHSERRVSQSGITGPTDATDVVSPPITPIATPITSPTVTPPGSPELGFNLNLPENQKRRKSKDYQGSSKQPYLLVSRNTNTEGKGSAMASTSKQGGSPRTTNQEKESKHKEVRTDSPDPMDKQTTAKTFTLTQFAKKFTKKE